MKYRKKPVIIEALQLEFSEIGIRKILEFMGQKVLIATTIERDKFTDYCNIVREEGFKLKTLESDNETQIANFGDYIVKGIQGEFYPCKPDIFKQSYEEVE